MSIGRLSLVVIGMAAGALAPVSAAGADPSTTAPLQPVAVIEGAPFMGDPVGIAFGQGRLHVLDPLEQAVWRLDPDTGAHEALDLPTHTAGSLFFACGDVLHVVDPGERAIFVLQDDGRSWRRRDLGYRVFFGAGDARRIAFNADRQHEAHLATLVGCGGDTLRLGARIFFEHQYASVANNLNYARLALSDGFVVVGHIAQGHLQVLPLAGGPAATFSLAGDEVQEVRRMYLRHLGRTQDGPLAVDRDSLIADLIAGARPQRFPVPVYINDLAVHDGRIWVLVNNTLRIHARGGELLARRAVGGERRGELVIIHAFCIAADGRLFGLDAVHYRKIYDFGPADALTAGRPLPGDEEKNESREESHE